MSVYLGSNKVGVISVSITSGGVVPSGTLSITQNGTVDVSEYASANVNVLPNLQAKTNITPTEESQTITPDSNYDALSSVKINAISSTYIGSDIAQNPTITTSGRTVTIPEGYYSSNQSVSITSATLANPSVSINSSTGLITATTTQSAGYVSAGSGSGTLQLSTQAAKTITPSTSSQTAVAAGKYTLGAITVAAIPSEYVVPSGSIEITANGEVDVTQYTTAVVAISGDVPTYQAKANISPTESSQTIYPDSGYNGLSSVQINAISSTYVGSGITRRSSTDLTASGATVSVPAGYYAAAASKSVTTMTLPTSAASSATSGYTSKATIGRSTSAQYINIPVGYNSAGAYYTISATPNGSVTAPSSISASSATVTTGTNTLTFTKTVSVTPNVTTAGYISTGTAGNASVSLTASVTTKAAATITPGTTDTTIAAGTYLTGAQTIKGDSNLIASNIKSGVTIFGVTGSAATGGGSAIVVTDTTDEGGGIIKEITAVDLSEDTVTAETLLSGYTAHDAAGNPITGIATAGGGTPTLQAKTNISPTESSQTIQPDSGYDGLSSVQINAISTTYVGSGITRRSSTDLTASGATVTVPAGYYSSQASKAVSSMTLPTSAASSATSGYTSKATIGRSTSNQYINIPPGYNASGAYYTISSVANGSATVSGSASGSSATVTTGTNTVTFTKSVSITPSVTAGYISSGTAGNVSVALTASITTKAAATITPGTSNQTIASGTYLTGTQTISGDANLVGSNILSGKSIFGVAGTVTFQTIYSGSSAPSSSTGVNGDVYIQTA